MKSLFNSLSKIVNTERGNALLMAVGAAAIIGVSSLYVLKNLDEGNKVNREAIKQLRGKVEGQKLIALAGFLVSSNFIACREEGWNDAGPDDQVQYCKWIGDRADAVGVLDLNETDGEVATQAEEFLPKDFGLYNQRISDEGHLVYDIIVSDDPNAAKNSFMSAMPDDNAEGDNPEYVNMAGIKEFTGTLAFEFVDLKQDKQLAKMVGMDIRDNLPEESMIRKTDRDDWVIHAKLNLKIVMVPEKTKTDEEGNTTVAQEAVTIPLVLGAAYRRPLAKAKLTVVQSVCQAKCPAPVSENDNAVCRGPQTSDNDTTVDIDLTLENEGPGFIYDIQYLRAMDYAEVAADTGNASGGTMTQSTDTQDSEEPVKFDLKSGYMPFNAVSSVTDKVECAAFVTRTQSVIYSSSVPSQTVVADSGTSDVGTDADPSQHSMRGGQVNYILSANEERSKIEPFRIMADVGAGSVAATHRNVHTTVYIYVAPSH